MRSEAKIRVLVIEPGNEGKHAEVREVGRNLEDFQGLVGGNIESLTLTREVSVYINEDGKALDLPMNGWGEALIRAGLDQTERTLMGGDWIAGPVVVVGPVDDDGWDQSVTEAGIELARSVGIEVSDAASPPQ